MFFKFVNFSEEQNDQYHQRLTESRVCFSSFSIDRDAAERLINPITTLEELLNFFKGNYNFIIIHEEDRNFQSSILELDLNTLTNKLGRIYETVPKIFEVSEDSQRYSDGTIFFKRDTKNDNNIEYAIFDSLSQDPEALDDVRYKVRATGMLNNIITWQEKLNEEFFSVKKFDILKIIFPIVDTINHQRENCFKCGCLELALSCKNHQLFDEMVAYGLTEELKDRTAPAVLMDTEAQELLSSCGVLSYNDYYHYHHNPLVKLINNIASEPNDERSKSSLIKILDRTVPMTSRALKVLLMINNRADDTTKLVSDLQEIVMEFIGMANQINIHDINSLALENTNFRLLPIEIQEKIANLDSGELPRQSQSQSLRM